MEIAVVIIAYNRTHALKRLLSSVAMAEYPNTETTLVISIDYQNSEQHNEVVQIAMDFEWKYGEKKIIEHQQNLGLRKHVLSCGCLTETYSAIIVLEDDIYVSKQYYNYAHQMLEVYGTDNSVAGISLYSHAWNVNANRPFMPEPSQYDVYLMQFAQSWGQCWNTRMWNGFYGWYRENKDKNIEGEDIPWFVKIWPDSSWLKYCITYTIRTDNFFVYPYYSLSTNFSDSGTHNKIFNTSYQVVLQSTPIQYRIPSLDDSIKYDAFFERIGIANILGLKETDLCVNLYGQKNGGGTMYLLTSKYLPFKILKSYGLYLRPHELNIICNIAGDDFFLYDTSVRNIHKNKRNKMSKVLLYDYKNLTLHKLLCVFKTKLMGR